MKSKITFAISVSALTVLISAQVSVRGSDEDREKQTRTHLWREPLGETVKASDILGKEVKNLQDETLGKVEDLAVDLSSGRIVYVVITCDRADKTPDKKVAVVSRNPRWDTTEGVLRFDLNKDKVKGAPAFDLTQWEDLSRSNRVVQIYGYYDMRPYFLAQQEGKRIVPPTTPLGYVARASKVIGMSVRNNQDEKLGTVENLMVNLERSRVSHVIVSSGGFLGLGDELSAMPPAAFRYGEGDKVLRLNATKDDLARAPHFKNSEWPNLNDPRYTDTVYRAYRVEPYFSTDFSTDVNADNTRRNSRDRDGNNLTPVDQGASSSDINTTQNIRRELIADENLSVNARNVKVITSGGRVTLRGPVNSEEEKLRVVNIVSKTVSPDRVDNQLEVRR